jgi:hypothetical protein
MEAERQNIQLHADILSLRKQLVAEIVQTEVSTSTTAPRAAKEIDMMTVSSHHTSGIYSQHISHSQCLISKKNSVLLKHLVTLPETDVPPSDQTLLCQQSINVDTLPITSNSSKHHGGKLFNEALQRPAGTETTQQSMVTGNLVSYSRDSIGPRNNYVTELHEFVEIFPGDVNSESTHNVKLKSDQNVEKLLSCSVAEQLKNVHLPSANGVTTLQQDGDLSEIQYSTVSDFCTQKLVTKSSDNSSVKNTKALVSLKEFKSGLDNIPIMCRSCALNNLHKCTKSSNDEGDGATDGSGNSDTHANAGNDTPRVQNLCMCCSLLRQTGEMDASFGSSYKHTDGDGSLHRLKNSVILILGKNNTSHKHVESSQTMDNLISLKMLNSSQCRREQLWDLEHYSQRHQEETCGDRHCSSVSRRNYSDSQKSEFDARCGNTGSQEMVCKSFHASKHGKREVSDTNDKVDSTTL